MNQYIDRIAHMRHQTTAQRDVTVLVSGPAHGQPHPRASPPGGAPQKCFYPAAETGPNIVGDIGVSSTEPGSRVARLQYTHTFRLDLYSIV
jgi:hypothetical protein